MRSFIPSAIAASAIFGQTAFGAVSAHRHGHAHAHAQKLDTRGVNALSRVGITAAESPAEGISTGNAGPFVVDFCNESGKDITVVLWSGASQDTLFTKMCVTSSTPSYTQAIPAGQNATISINPGTNAKLSGGWAALYPITDIAQFGGINNTWGEWTYQTTDDFSAVDVSSLINMVGNGMKIETYGAYPSSGESPACVSDMSTCVFQCVADPVTKIVPNTCPGGQIQNCSGPNTQNNGATGSGSQGGCGGFTSTGGYTKVSFLE